MKLIRVQGVEPKRLCGSFSICWYQHRYRWLLQGSAPVSQQAFVYNYRTSNSTKGSYISLYCLQPIPPVANLEKHTRLVSLDRISPTVWLKEGCHMNWIINDREDGIRQFLNLNSASSYFNHILSKSVSTSVANRIITRPEEFVG